MASQSPRARARAATAYELMLPMATSIALSAFGCSGETDADAQPPHKTDASFVESGSDGSADGGVPCTPRTCDSLGATCGSAPDGCGGSVKCGQCPPGQFCGGGGANRCGSEACVPLTCGDFLATCGVLSDGCGEAISCGECSPPETCGGGGVDYQCACKAKTCAEVGAQCGTMGDGCGLALYCGDCAPGESCNTSGQCALSCPTNWKTQAGSGLNGAALRADGALMVGGNSASQGWVAELDPCSGQLGSTHTVTVSGASSSLVKSLVVSGDDLFVVGNVKAGTDPLNGMHARLSASNLALLWAFPLIGSNLSDEAWGVTAAPDGSIWVAGSSTIENGAQPWVVKATSSGGACGFHPVAGAGHARAVVSGPDGVYVSWSVDGTGYLARFDPSNCSCPGSCAPTWLSAPIKIGAKYTEGRTIVLAGTTAYVGGFVFDDATEADGKAFIASINLSTGVVASAWTWNPSATLDLVQSLGSDGQSLYAAMMTNYDAADTGKSRAYVLRLPVAIKASTTPVWALELPFMNAALGVAVEQPAGGGVYFVGRSATAGWVAKCTKFGVCPN